MVLSLQKRARTDNSKLLPFVVLGFGLGLLIGYIFLGTLHAVLTSGTVHHGHILLEPGDAGSGKDDSGKPLLGSDTILPVSEQQQTQIVQGQELAAGQAAATSQTQSTAFPSKGTNIHTLVTSNGSPYLNFQTRIMYGTYKKVQAMPGGERLVAFTRVLHRTVPDVLMQEVPTYRADPLTPSCDTWCEFPVSDRPNAVAQWLRAAKQDSTMIQAPWLLMIETDYVWLKPPRAPPAEDWRVPSWAFPFTYIVPQAPALAGVLRKMYSEAQGPLSDVPGSGPAPVMLRVHELFKVVPDWERLTAHIEADKESKDRLGWVREMYAFSVAAALQGIKLELLPPPKSPLIAQPPADRAAGAASMLHYTWGDAYLDSNNTIVWEFDKRTYTAAEIQTQTPNIPPPPPFIEGWHLRDGGRVTRQLYDTVKLMVTTMNAAVDLLPK